MNVLYVVVIIGVAIGVLSVLEYLARSHATETLHGRVSDAWLNEQIRGRRDL